MKKNSKILSFFVLFTLIFISVCFGINESVKSSIIFLVAGKEYCLIPEVNIYQNLVKNDKRNITVTLWKQSLINTSDYFLSLDSIVTGTVTTPSLTIETILLDNNMNGNYTYNYTFSESGTYKIEIKAVSASSLMGGIFYTLSRVYVYVGKFPINIEVISQTQYKTGENAEVDIYVEDESGNPIEGGSAIMDIYYPNKTAIFVNDGNFSEIGGGLYYYNFTTPSTEGKYVCKINFTKGINSDYDSTTFDVGGWANDINNSTEIWNYPTRILTDYNQTEMFADLANIETSIGNVALDVTDVKDLATEINSTLYEVKNTTVHIESYVINITGNMLTKREIAIEVLKFLCAVGDDIC